jgi:cellulose synthase/poly-beta-1,6-N-acetylglucosamine synthase-like glycosyltransferase
LEYFFLGSKIFVTVVYVFSLLLLCSLGIHRYYLLYIYSRKKNNIPKLKGRFSKLPKVTIQLPVFNEMYVVERLISSVCEIDYPKELLQIQVLDDSNDQTTEIANRCVQYFKDMGFYIVCLHRDNRDGYKAGALSEGLKSAEGDLIAIFDADFIPPKDFLKKTVDYFYDPKVGILQVRWGHVNPEYSMLTKAQSILLDGHFMIEQSSRFNNGLFFNFNGTAGVLRKSCIETSGGWQQDTLTEDLDLSYRAQLEGWKLIYLKDLIADAEVPVDMNAFKSQQHRWAKGTAQTAIKILPRILKRDDLSIKIKAEALFHFFGYISYLPLLMLLLLMFPMGYFWQSVGIKYSVVFNMAAIMAGTLSFVLFYLMTLFETHRDKWYQYVLYVPITLSIGVGLTINNAKAVIEAFMGKSSAFVRTPKYAVTSKDEAWLSRNYVSSKQLTVMIEITLGIIFLVRMLYAVSEGDYGFVPFLLMLQFGFLYVAYYSFLHSRGKKII